MKKNCIEECIITDTSCGNTNCKYWLEHPEDLNCMFVSIQKNGAHTLQQIGDRLNISAVRVKQIQDKAFLKMKSFVKNFDVS
jgi:hypothetical protein